jgi:hypothetical protein
MNKKLFRILIAIIGLCSLLWLLPWLKAIPYISQQQKLAEFLEVDIKDYRQTDFPYEYFAQALTPGMSIREVHQVVRGYDRVLSCGDYSEIYYYFHIDDYKAFRYEIMYIEKRLKEFSTDDIYNSWRISSDGCVDGQLEE